MTIAQSNQREYAADVVGQTRTWQATGTRNATTSQLAAVVANFGVVNRANEVLDPGAFGRQRAPLEAWGHDRSKPNNGDGVVYEDGADLVWDGEVFPTAAAQEEMTVIRGNGPNQEYSITFEIRDAFRDRGGRLHITQAVARGVTPVHLGISPDTHTVRMLSAETQAAHQGIRSYAAEAGGEMPALAERAIAAGVANLAEFQLLLQDNARRQSIQVDLQRIRRYEGDVANHERSSLIRFLGWQNGQVPEVDAPRESVMWNVARDEGLTHLADPVLNYGMAWLPPTLVDDFTTRHLGRRLSITGAHLPTERHRLTSYGVEIGLDRAATPYPHGIRGADAASLRMYATNTLAQSGAPLMEGWHLPPERVLADLVSLTNTRILGSGLLEYWIQSDGSTPPAETAEGAAPPEANLTETRHTIDAKAFPWALPQSELSAIVDPGSVERRIAQAMAAMDEAYQKKILNDILTLGSGPGNTGGITKIEGTADAFASAAAHQGKFAADVVKLRDNLWDVPIYGRLTMVPSNGFLGQADVSPRAAGVGPPVRQNGMILDDVAVEFAPSWLPNNYGTRAGALAGPGDALLADFLDYIHVLYAGLYVRITNAGGPTLSGNAGMMRPELWLVHGWAIPRPTHFAFYESKANS